MRISSALNSELKASASAVVGVAAGANGGDRAFLGQPPGILHRGQYTSLAFTEALLEAGIAGSIGSVGDALDNALMESTIGLYKTELIDRQRSWTGRNAVERETAAWVHWFNTERLHSALDYRPPVEFEDRHRHRGPCRGLNPASVKSKTVQAADAVYRCD